MSGTKIAIGQPRLPWQKDDRSGPSCQVLVAWFCHPCDTGWREQLPEQWQQQNPFPPSCGDGGKGYSEPPMPGYSEPY